MPGSPLDPRCEGSNGLLKQGATLVTEAADVIAVLRADPRPADRCFGARSRRRPPPHDTEPGIGRAHAHRRPARADAGRDRRSRAAVRQFARRGADGPARTRAGRPARTPRRRPGVARCSGLSDPRPLTRERLSASRRAISRRLPSVSRPWPRAMSVSSSRSPQHTRRRPLCGAARLIVRRSHCSLGRCRWPVMADSAQGDRHIQFRYCIQTIRLVIVAPETPLGLLFTLCCDPPGRQDQGLRFDSGGRPPHVPARNAAESRPKWVRIGR